jgi:hypothetical protein
MDRPLTSSPVTAVTDPAYLTPWREDIIQPPENGLLVGPRVPVCHPIPDKIQPCGISNAANEPGGSTGSPRGDITPVNYYANFMELSPSSEATSCAATQEHSKMLWNPKVHCFVHKSPPLVPILSQIDLIHTTPSYLTKLRLHIIHPPTSWSSQCSF